MAPACATAWDADTSLKKIHESVSKLGALLKSSAEAHSQLHHDVSGQKPGNKDLSSAKKLQVLAHQALIHGISAKVAHDAIIDNIDISRKKLRVDQDKLHSNRLRLENLTYEKRILQREINACRGSSSSVISKLNIDLPRAVNCSESDKACDDAHGALMDTLNSELGKRRAMKNEVDEAVAATKSKRRKLMDTKQGLRELPKVIKSLSSVIEPVKGSLQVSESSVGSVSELERVYKLPGPLYILARQALAYREVSLGEISVEVLGVRDVTGDEGFEAKRKGGVYLMHPMRVQIDIHDMTGADRVLRVWFRYHVNLEIITVRSVMVVEGKETPSFPTKELQMLYPFDYGEESPNACNAHLQNGSFKFELQAAQKGRPYVWANMICGVPCLKGMKGGDQWTESEKDIAKWPERASEVGYHKRFKDVIVKLQNRMKAIISLKAQIEALLNRELPISGGDVGLPGEIKAKIVDFVKLSADEWKGKPGLGRRGTEGRYTEVWCMSVSTDAVKVKCMIGVEPDYPVGSPVFRLERTDGNGGVTEKDIVELERCVNEHGIQPQMAERDIVLGAQIAAMLTYMDRLEAVSASMDEGVVDSGTGEVRGRTRCKRDSMLRNLV